ncbi:MAG: four helix bundle protein [Bacteroidales bacterium]|nr:four helix bundle protein [Bacteroidales bacterium]
MENKSENIIVSKTYAFALKAIRLYKSLLSNNKYILSKQFLKSATSIGANVEEAIGGQSKKDFIAKLSISYKEAREVHYWIRLLKDSSLINLEIANDLLMDCEEILKILTANLKTSKSN